MRFLDNSTGTVCTARSSLALAAGLGIGRRVGPARASPMAWVVRYYIARSQRSDRIPRLATHDSLLNWRHHLEEPRAPQVGQEAPDFTLPATTGGTITLSQYRGQKIVVLAFYVLDWTGG